MFLSPNFDAATGIFLRRAPTPPQEELRAELGREGVEVGAASLGAYV
jgi:hypothetical protein